MRVEFEAQLLFEAQRTGIGNMAYETIRAMTQESEVEGILNFFTMGKRKNHDKQWAALHELEQQGYELNACGWFHNVWYKMLWVLLPVPYRLFFGGRADVTHFFNYHVPPFVAGKRVATVCDMVCMAYPETMSTKTRWMLKLTLRRSVKRAHHLVTISEFSKREIMRYLGVPEGKITVVPCGVDQGTYHAGIDRSLIEQTRKKYGLDERYFLYLGTLEPRKNLVRLVQAYAQLCQDHQDVPQLCLAGRKGWQYDEIFATVRASGLEHKVVFTDYVPTEDCAPLLAGALAFVFPSVYEGFGLPPLEAMACGTPVIVADAASLPEVVGEAGLLVDPLDERSIAQAMARVMEEESLRSTMRERGLMQAQRFTWRRAAQQLVALYQTLLEDGNK